MTGLLSALLFAAPAKPSAAESMMPTLIMFGGFFFIIYFIMLRPQQQQERRRQEMIKALKKNDKVLTLSGIFGTVAAVEDRWVMLRVDDDRGVKIKVSRASIERVLDAEEKDKPAEVAKGAS